MACQACERCVIGVVGVDRAGSQTGRGVTNRHHSRSALESATTEGDSPVGEMMTALWICYPSTTGHVKSCGNLGGPPSKAKYSLVTDSAQVPVRER